ncbi:MAG TPA: carboxypeptidase regulatory-like domain-containing protein [Gemmatimonadales bacterium]|nr:carboxypeptidase regulatory-like domain-containing protein [Gemmatimonadales bacterium]
MRLLPLAVISLSLGCASLGAREAPPPPGLARITGVVIDSVTRAGVLPGATVALPELARFTHADERGRFRFDSIPPGRHLITASHPALDSVRLYQLSASVNAPGGRVSEAIVATPSPTHVYATICGEDMADYGVDGVVLGALRDSRSGLPVHSGEIRIRWSELILADQFAEQARVAAVPVDSGGQFAICGAFADAILEVQAVHGDRRSGVMLLPGEGQVLRAVDIALGDGLGISIPVEITDAEAGELVPADTVISVLRAEGPGVVAGRVQAGGRPLAGALVELAGVALQVRTNGDGEFRLTGIPIGSHSLHVRSLGYRNHIKPIVVDTELRDTIIVSLESAPNTLDVVQIIGSRARSVMALEEVHRRSQLGITKLVDIEHVKRVGLSGALRMQPFVYWLGQGTQRVIAFRTMGRYCLPNIVVDGKAVPRNTVNVPGGFDLDFWVSVSEIAAVEYVRGSSPPAFGSYMQDAAGEMDPGGQCGTIAIWRK